MYNFNFQVNNSKIIRESFRNKLKHNVKFIRIKCSCRSSEDTQFFKTKSNWPLNIKIIL